MQIIKIKRLKNPEAVEAERKMRCEVCAAPAHGGPHHIVTVGAGGPDLAENLIQLCWQCHYGKLPAGRLTKARLIRDVAERIGIDPSDVRARIAQAMGRGIKREGEE